jgi:hypothetical protein
MAASTTVFSVTPLAGIDLAAKGSAAPGGLAALTTCMGNDGHEYILVRASEALGSIETVKVGTSGSASTDSGSAGFTMNAPGGLVATQYGWAKKTAL